MLVQNTLVDDCLRRLKNYLPAQATLKDFVADNMLKSYQNELFEKAIRKASKVFGYRVSLSLPEYRDLFNQGRIDVAVLENIILKRKGSGAINEWKQKLLLASYNEEVPGKIGKLRRIWKDVYHLDLNTIVHTNLFRILNSYLDQGVAITRFPTVSESLIDSLIAIESNSFTSFFKTPKARKLLMDPTISINSLLEILVEDESLYEQYLFDQQFAHPGWSGLVATIEKLPQSILDARKITLNDLILLECLLEIDNLDHSLGNKWKPIAQHANENNKIDLFEEEPFTELDELLTIWQEAMEWTYFDQVLLGIKIGKNTPNAPTTPTFQAYFCIDDRECSIRRYIEHFDNDCQTYGTPGHFAVDTFYQPKNGKFYSKVCPFPVQPKHVIKEVSTSRENDSDWHFKKSSHSLFHGWLITQTLGFWSAIKLVVNIFKPSLSPANTYSFSHMEQFSTLTVENRSPRHQRDGLQVGYTILEMTDRVEIVLKSTGLISGFAPLIYMIGHGSSSANNTHYAAYDCGACSGRPGSVNARAFSYMANHKEVRKLLVTRGIEIPETTEFLGGLHDTTRDEFRFYDAELLAPQNIELHTKNLIVFDKALRQNAKERSRIFRSLDSSKSAEYLHKKIKERSVSLFEPRPELTHTNNSLCIIGRRKLNDHLFLDRRAFLNSYDSSIDPEGTFLQTIINAAAPVCGGINLCYYFSRVDNEKFGAGSKLPHNVMGLIGVANGYEGDLRPGLPTQMVEVHNPLRLLMVIEHAPEVVINTIQRSNSIYEWFINEWVVLCVVDPKNGEIYKFKNGEFQLYEPELKHLDAIDSEDLARIIETTVESTPVYLLK